MKLNVGDMVERVMVVARIVKRDFKGGRFILFQFVDRDRRLKGILWDPSDKIEAEIKTDDVVRVSGKIQEYEGALQIKVSEIEKLDESDFDSSLFLPVSSRDPGELYDEILKMIASVSNEDIRKLLQTIFEDDAFKTRFIKAPAAMGWHHSYLGGLVEHVYDMSRIALKTAEVYPEVDRDILLAGVFLHDIGKLEELSVTNTINYTDRGRLLGHISMGIDFINEYLRGLEGFPEDVMVKLKHMILSHHGSMENGSPVVPMTLEAMLLHYIDNMDAQVRGAIQTIDQDEAGDGNWTRYVRLLNRFIYRGDYNDNDRGEEE
jgi:3'-5' exoribonuclease